MVGVSIVGFYHLWEKQIIKHLIRELLHEWEIKEKYLPKKLEDIVNIFKFYSTDFSKLPFYTELNELRLVANTVKHGRGKSFKQLVATKADIIQPYLSSDNEPIIGGEHALLRAEIYPRIEHFMKYKEGVLAFWEYNFWHRYGERLPYSGNSK